MKKIISCVLVMFSLVLFTGCEPVTIDNVSNDKIQNITETLNMNEKKLLNGYIYYYYSTDYDLVYNDIALNRKHFGKPIEKRDSKLVPFCDVIQKVVAVEQGLPDYKQEHTISQQWFDTYGLTLSEQCQIESNQIKQEPTVVITPIEKVQEESELIEKETSDIQEATVVIGDQLFLKPDQIRELRTSVKTCRRAQNKMLDILDANEDLTIEHYKIVTKEIVACERALLENDLNLR